MWLKTPSRRSMLKTCRVDRVRVGCGCRCGWGGRVRCVYGAVYHRCRRSGLWAVGYGPRLKMGFEAGEGTWEVRSHTDRMNWGRLGGEGGSWGN